MHRLLGQTAVDPLRLAAAPLAVAILVGALTGSLAPLAVGFGLLFVGWSVHTLLSARHQLLLGRDRPWSHHLRELTCVAWALLSSLLGIMCLALVPLLGSTTLAYWVIVGLLILALLALSGLAIGQLVVARVEARHSKRVDDALRNP